MTRRFSMKTVTKREDFTYIVYDEELFRKHHTILNFHLLLLFLITLYILLFKTAEIYNYLWIIFYVLFIGAVLSWFNRGNNPAFYALYQLTEPLLKPIKRILPTVGVIDFSPMVIAIILLFLNNLFYDYFNLLWAIAA